MPPYVPTIHAPPISVNIKKRIANFQRLEIRYNFTGEFVLHVMFVVHGTHHLQTLINTTTDCSGGVKIPMS